MAATRLALAALRLPWKDLLKAAPVVLRVSGELAARLADRRRGGAEPPPPPADTATLAMRLDALETAAEAQAQITNELVGRIQEVSEVLPSLALRIRFALGLSLLALVLAVIALVRTFF